MEAPKTRVLLYGDYGANTGFGTVMSNIAQQLHKTGKYEIDVLGINYTGDPVDPERWPGRIFPAMVAQLMVGPYADIYGRQKLLDLLGKGNYDVLFMVQDTFIIQEVIDQIRETQEKHPHKFKTVFYFPIDAKPKAEWVEKVVAQIDFPVPYTNYAKQECLNVIPGLNKLVDPIYHGTNLKDFFYVENREEIAKFRKQYFGEQNADKFIVMNINRNQSRKDTARNLQVLAELRRRGINDVLFYLHMAHEDQGGNVLVMADNFGLKLGEDFLLPSPGSFNPHTGLPVEAINYLYNAADAVFTPTLGEGWGLSVTEAMATKTPVIAPNHTSLTEILGDSRGFLVQAGTNPSLWITKEGDMERSRPLMDVEDAARIIEHIKKNAKAADLQERIQIAYDWVLKLNWEAVCERWIEVIDKAAGEADRANALQADFANPNREQRRRLAKERRDKANV